MNVKLKSNIEPVRQHSVVKKAPQKATPPADTVRLDESAKLDQSFAVTPEVRPEAVERAKKLIADADYPSKETIRNVATLLATKLQTDSE